MSGTVRVGHLFRKRTVRKLSGEIIDMSDEARGGAIIRNGRVVNPEIVEEIQKKEADRREAAKAVAHQVSTPAAVVEERVAAPGRMEALEKRVDGMDEKLDAILGALKPKA